MFTSCCLGSDQMSTFRNICIYTYIFANVYTYKLKIKTFMSYHFTLYHIISYYILFFVLNIFFYFHIFKYSIILCYPLFCFMLL